MCNCIKEVNQSLVEHNSRLALSLSLRKDEPTRVIIKTEKIESHRGFWPITLTAGFCPFCGAEYTAESTS